MFTHSFGYARQAGIATTLALIVTFGIASPALADDGAADPDAVAAKTRCSSAVDALLATDVVAANIADPESSTVQYLCAADAIQLTEATSDPTTDYTVVQDTATGEITDLTGLSAAEVADSTIPVELDQPAVAATPTVSSARSKQPSIQLTGGTVNSQYRSSGSTIITYGDVGKWSAQVRVSMWISLAFVSHTLEVTYQPLTGGHTIHMDMPMRMQRVIFPIQTVDSTVVSVGYYSAGAVTKQFRLSSLYQRQEKYYPETYNNKLWDLGRGTFNVSLNFTLPTFQCYKTVQCKYPDGRAA